MSKQIVRIAPSRSKEEYVKRDVCTDLRYILILDVETTLDFSMKLRLAGYCLYDSEAKIIKEEGFLYDSLDSEEMEILEAYCTHHSLKLWKRYDFITKRFYPLLKEGVSYANHNVKFDLGSLVTSWYYPDKDTIAMVLCDCLGITGYDAEGRNCTEHPSINVHHLPSGKYLFNVRTDTKTGAIIDTLQLGKALLGASVAGSLLEMGKKFRCEKVKFISEEHGNKIQPCLCHLCYTGDNQPLACTCYLCYTHNDVEATLELFLKEVEEYARHGINKPLASLVSEASLGKGYLEKAGIMPFYKRHTNIPEWYERVATITYKGGRSEVMHRLKPVEIAYLDFMSQYSLVNALLDLQSVLLASSISTVHVTDKIRYFLKTFKLEDLQRKETWQKLRVFVKIRPEGDILPVESREEGDYQTTLRNTYLYGAENWYTLCDVIGSIIRTGNTPYIIDAVELIPYGEIPFMDIKFYGKDEYVISRKKGDDLFASLIDLRSEVKKEWAKHARDTEDYVYYESLQNGMKLVANSTAYGALAESREVRGIDVAGKYACYALASHITGGARLLLSIAEALGMKHGFRYVMCDTDSMAFARPESLDRQKFMEWINQICEWFSPLSPFKSSKDIFELEAVNGDKPLYFIGVSSKRYVVFHILDNGTYAIRKATVNGVGAVMFDMWKNARGGYNFTWPEDIPNPNLDARYKTAKGVKPLYDYQYLLWYRCIEQVMQGCTDIAIPIEEWSSQIVRMSVGMNTPYTLKIHSHIKGIRPFSFLTKLPHNPSAYYLSGARTSKEIEEADIYRKETGRIETNPQYKYLYQHFREYFNHPEAKVLDGSAIGFLEKIVARVNTVSYTTRKGKEVSEQQTIFDLLEKEV